MISDGKEEDTTKKHVFAKIRSEMTDTIFRDSADLVEDLVKMSGKMRAFNEKRLEPLSNIVNKKIPHIIDKFEIISQESEKRQHQYSELQQKLICLRESVKFHREELATAKEHYRKNSAILSNLNEKHASLENTFYASSTNKSEEIAAMEEVIVTFASQFKCGIIPRIDGVGIKMPSGKIYTITPTSVLNGSVIRDLREILQCPSGYQPTLNDFHELLKNLDNRM